MADLLLDDGVYVVWVAAPHLDVGRMQETRRPRARYPESDPARIDRFNEIIREVVNARDGAVVVELGEFLKQQPGGEMDATYEAPDGAEQPLRPDGVHFDEDSAVYLARNGPRRPVPRGHGGRAAAERVRLGPRRVAHRRGRSDPQRHRHDDHRAPAARRLTARHRLGRRRS